MSRLRKRTHNDRTFVALVVMAFLFFGLIVWGAETAAATHDNSTYSTAMEYTEKCSDRNAMACQAATTYWYAYSHGGGGSASPAMSSGDPCPTGVWKRENSDERVAFTYTNGLCYPDKPTNAVPSSTTIAIAAAVVVATVLFARRR